MLKDHPRGDLDVFLRLEIALGSGHQPIAPLVRSFDTVSPVLRGNRPLVAAVDVNDGSDERLASFGV